MGTPYPYANLPQLQPHLTESNGVKFDGNDYLSLNVIKSTSVATSAVMTFGSQFTVEMWVRFTETEIS